MKFNEWWDTEGKLPEDTLGYRELKAWASLAFEAGVKEGLRRAVEERSDTTQGGGSQTPAPVAQPLLSVEEYAAWSGRAPKGA